MLIWSNYFCKNSEKEKDVYSRYETTFDSAGSWSFDNGFAGNVISFRVDHSLSSHSDTRQNNFLILGESVTFGIHGSFGLTEKKFNIIFTKANTQSCLIFHYNPDNSYWFLNLKEIFKFKAYNKKVSFPTQLCLGRISDGFSDFESREVSLNGDLYDFTVCYKSIDILNIHKSLMTQNNMK